MHVPQIHASQNTSKGCAACMQEAQEISGVHCAGLLCTQDEVIVIPLMEEHLGVIRDQNNVAQTFNEYWYL